MILLRETMTQSCKKGRLSAISLLDRWSQLGRLPPPHYQYEPGGHGHKASHHYTVHFRIPQVLKQCFEDDSDSDSVVLFETSVKGSGRDKQKQFAKTLAALEVVHRLERMLELPRGSNVLEELAQQLEQQQQQQQSQQSAATTKASWNTIPLDDSQSFRETLPASRRGTIDFGLLLGHTSALTAAKALTLTARQQLPQTSVHGTKIDGGLLQYVHVRQTRGSILPGHAISPRRRNFVINRDYAQGLTATLETIYQRMV